MRGFLMPLPDFNLENFPFLIVSGKFSIALLNVKTGYFEPIVKASTSLMYGQQAFFFQRTDFGVKLNIATSSYLTNGNKRLEWL